MPRSGLELDGTFRAILGERRPTSISKHMLFLAAGVKAFLTPEAHDLARHC